MSSVEIKVDENTIRELVEDIDTIRIMVECVKISTRVTESRGQVASALNGFIDEIHSFRDELVVMLEKNRMSVEDIANKFAQTDSELSGKYQDKSNL